MMSAEIDRAQAMALKALGYIAEQDDLCAVFLGSTGASLTDLRDQAENPAFLASVLDFLMMDDAWVIGFCDSEQLGYDAPMRARQSLPGADTVHWT